MAVALMPQRSNGKTQNRIVRAVAGLILLVPLNVASAMDAMDRKMEMDMNRDRAESRIDRLHEDQNRSRTQKNKATKKQDDTSKRRLQRLQY
jgi:hypothetical protein